MLFISIINDPWSWYFSGAVIALVMFFQIFFGKRFGISSSFERICTIAGAQKLSDYFDRDWKAYTWNFMFIFGAMIGAYLASHYMTNGEPIKLAEATLKNLDALGLDRPGSTAQGGGYLPENLFSWQSLTTLRGFIAIIGGGFLIGFGSRYAGGCTSGHAITGLSNLQLPSLVAVIGFFIGGLLMTWVLLPLILNL